MSKYIFKHVLGVFVLDENLKIIDKGDEKSLIKKYSPEKPDDELVGRILKNFKDAKFFKEFRTKNLELTKKWIKESTKDDTLIIQAVDSIGEINKVTNILATRLREWYELYNPEFSDSIQDHEKFSELIVKKSRKELLKEVGVVEKESMGSDMAKDDLEPVFSLAKEINKMFELKGLHEKYLEKVMKRACPNMTAIAGALIGGKLIEHAGSLHRLMEFPASTVQLLGAEKALFRHMKTKAKPPKYGVIFNHPLITRVGRQDQGKAARALADKIALAVKIDYFKGKFIGDKMRKELDARFV